MMNNVLHAKALGTLLTANMNMHRGCKNKQIKTMSCSFQIPLSGTHAIFISNFACT